MNKLEARNPLLRYKENMDMTYDELAKQFDVNRSVIQRAIEGAYWDLPPKIREVLAYVEGKSQEAINREYQQFVAAELSKVKLFPVAEPISHETSVEDFEIWCSLLLRINGVNFVGKVPALSVARLLKLNVAVIANFLNGRTATLPAQIIERIGQIEGNKNGDSVQH